MKLVNSLDAWGSPSFESVLKSEIQDLDHEVLPLQQALTQSSVVSDSAFSATILKVTETQQLIQVKAGIMYSGIIAGSCCADDPTPLCEETEYCEVLLDIDKSTAQTSVTLLPG
ncbi:MAG: hypothetical protein PVG20_03425 [Thioalkalispiraceae bacterium]|jgi:hypothetical protein